MPLVSNRCHQRAKQARNEESRNTSNTFVYFQSAFEPDQFEGSDRGGVRSPMRKSQNMDVTPGRQIVLAARPKGKPRLTDFPLEEVTIPTRTECWMAIISARPLSEWQPKTDATEVYTL